MSERDANYRELTSEEATQLLTSIFEVEPDEDEDDYPKTIREKVSCAESDAIGSLDHLGWAIKRLSKFNRMLSAVGDGLPKIIAHNEAKISLERLLHVKLDIDDAVAMMEQVMDETRPDKEVPHE